MPIQVQCPHCRSLCQVGEQHVGTMVTCGRCTKPFKVAGATPPPVASPAAPEKEGLRGVLKAIMPFSKIDDAQGPLLIQPAAPSASATPARLGSSDDDVRFDFSPEAEAALRQPHSPTPSIPIPAGANWNAPTAIGVCRLEIGAATAAGMVRPRNEDSYLVHRLSWATLDQRNELAVVVVADGMGGHDAGDRASHLAIQTIGASLTATLLGVLSGQVKDNSASALAPAIENALKVANQQVYRRAQSEPGCRGMGATCSTVLIWNGQVVIGHVGDTRVYIIRGGKATQLTRDQTLVEKMVRLGQLTAQQAAVHPARNEVAQAIGRQADVEPAVSHFKMLPGDWLVIACDGLHAHVDLPLLEKTARESPASATLLAHKLVQLANDRGGSDNCTVVAVHCY